MKAYIIILLITVALVTNAQTPPPLTLRHEQQLENLAELDESIVEDESFLQQLEAFRKNPVNLNTANEDDLQLLQILNSIQIKALLQYRALLGKFIHIYELQAIPYWDVLTIQRLLPYITIREEIAAATLLSSVMQNGSANLLFRLSRSTPKAAGFIDTGANRFLGSPEKMLVRYRYSYKNILQFGILGDKDAGEALLNKNHKTGFDFYSLHLFARKLGIIQSLAIGDFAVNMGQGLLQWQSMAFGKGELTAIKRQSAVLRPYTSAGESNFQRGIGIALRQKQLMLTAFYAVHKISANLSEDTSGQVSISSFITSGLHRNAKELAERNNIMQQSAGCNVSYERAGWHLGGNIIQYQFSDPVLKRQEPYNLFSFRGDRWLAFSLDYDYTFRNLHLFGEVAADKWLNKAIINGLLLSLDRKLDMSILVRHLEPGFQPFNASAFTEGTLPSNESGIFIGLAFRPLPRLKLDAYADAFRFPWLKSRADAPSLGQEYQVQLSYQPRKTIELATRFRSKALQTNNSGDDEPFHTLTPVRKITWRTHLAWQPGPEWQVSQRVELVWFRSQVREQGYLLYADLRYSPAKRPYAVAGRVQVFETDGFNSRIYAYEQDAGFAAPAAYHKGLRYYINLQMDLNRRYFKVIPRSFPHINIWFRWAATIAEMQAPPAFPSNKGEYKIQINFSSF